MSVISHRNFVLQPLDWAQVRSMAVEPAANALRSKLRDLDGAEKQVFALRGMCGLLIEERELYRWVVDEEVGDYYTSLDRFLKQEFPNSWGYIRDAMRAVKELKDMPFEDLLQIKRANLEQLKKVSSSVRILPEVVAAAKSLPEKQFVSKLNSDHAQHLEIRQPVVMASTGDCDELETAIALAITIEGCGSRSEALKAIAVSYIQDHQGQVEQTA